MPDSSHISPYTASCGGGLILNKDVYNMQPGEALQLSNFEPSVKGGYRRLNGTTKYNSTIVPQVSASSERVLLSAIFNDIIIELNLSGNPIVSPWADKSVCVVK